MQDIALDKILQATKNSDNAFAEIFIESSELEELNFSNNKLESYKHGSDQGAGIRLIEGLDSAYAYSNDLNEQNLHALAQSLKSAFPAAASHKKITLKKQGTNYLKNSKHLDPLQDHKQKLALCEEANELARQKSPLVHQVEIQLNQSLSQRLIANSDGLLVNSPLDQITLAITITIKKDDDLITALEALAFTGNFKDILKQDWKSKVIQTTERAIQQLSARTIKGGPMPVVISSEAGGTLIHEAVGHGLEGDLVAENLSVFKNKLGTAIASPKITVIDDPTLSKNYGSYPYDDEGTKTQKTVLIENGILKNYLCDRLAAKRLQLQPTGNARRESYEHRPLVRMSNTYVAPGSDNPQEILASVDKGLFVKRMGGGQVDTVTGEFVFEAEEAYLIKNGKITDPIKNASLIGNGPRLLKEIDMIGNDLHFCSGVCGKDNQSVPVTDAIPTLRIPNMVVGGK